MLTWWHDTKGDAVVEFVLIIPTLVLLIFMTIIIGYGIVVKLIMVDATKQGMDLAVTLATQTIQIGTIQIGEEVKTKEHVKTTIIDAMKPIEKDATKIKIDITPDIIKSGKEVIIEVTYALPINIDPFLDSLGLDSKNLNALKDFKNVRWRAVARAR